MKKHFGMLITTAFVLALGLAHAQPGGGSGGPGMDSALAKLFGTNSAFSAKMEIAAADAVMPGKMFFLDGKSRVEMKTSEAKGSKIPPEAAEQMKSMGMDKMIAISRPDKQVAYIIYPDLKSYAAMPAANTTTNTKPEDLNVKTTELGKDTAEGHPCVKNKKVITDKQGATVFEATVWNATDMKDFPVKIEQNKDGQQIVMTFTDVKLGKPDGSLFEPPTDFKKYSNIQEMMQETVMKRFHGGAGAPAAPGQ